MLNVKKTRGPKGHCRPPEYNERERNVGIEPKIAAVSEEKSKMSQPIRGQGGHFVFSPIGLKNTNVVEGIESLLPVKFR